MKKHGKTQREVYKGAIQLAYIKNFKLNDGKVEELEIGTKLVDDNVMFYENMLGVIIRFDTQMPIIKRYEAYDYVMNHALNGNTAATCPFSEEPYESVFIPTSEFKKQKKLVKEARKKKK